jgi:putative membrane protein
MLYFFKALHVVGFVSWFAGLFYLVRMFVYHAEAFDKPSPEKEILVGQFSLMERRVFRVICQPAMGITWLAGLSMLALDLTGIDPRGYFSAGAPYWMTVKLVLLFLLSGYHSWCGRLIERLQSEGRPVYSGWQFRLLNELPTLFLIAIAFVAVYGRAGTLNYLYLALGMFIFVIVLYWGARAYRRRRERRNED